MVPNGDGYLMSMNKKYKAIWTNGRSRRINLNERERINGFVTIRTIINDLEDQDLEDQDLGDVPKDNDYVPLTGHFVNGIINGYGTSYRNNICNIIVSEILFRNGLQNGRRKDIGKIDDVDAVIQYAYSVDNKQQGNSTTTVQDKYFNTIDTTEEFVTSNGFFVKETTNGESTHERIGCHNTLLFNMRWYNGINIMQYCGVRNYEYSDKIPDPTYFYTGTCVDRYHDSRVLRTICGNGNVEISLDGHQRVYKINGIFE